MKYFQNFKDLLSINILFMYFRSEEEIQGLSLKCSAWKVNVLLPSKKKMGAGVKFFFRCTVKKNLGLKPSKYGLPRTNLLKLVCFPVESYPSSY